jgi:hypothetical protein
MIRFCKGKMIVDKVYVLVWQSWDRFTFGIVRAYVDRDRASMDQSLLEEMDAGRKYDLREIIPMKEK